MKKEFIIGGFVVLILVSLFSICFVYAQDNGEKSPEDAEDIKQEAERLGQELKQKEKKVLETEIEIPENLQVVVRILFGVKGSINLQEFVVLIAVWVMLLLIIVSFLQLTPLLSGWKSWAGAITITSIISVIGVVRNISIFFFNLGNAFSFLQKWSILKIVFVIVLAIVLIWLASFVSKIIKKKLMLEEAEMKGAKAGAGAKIMEETFEQVTGE